MQAQRNGVPMLASSGYTARIAAEECIACGSCREVCQFQALTAAEDGTTRVEADKCMGCGVCVSHCPQEAIELVLTPARGIPLEIHRLMEQAAAEQTN
jgi:MinD superfamily P-loop ATPase